MRSSEGAFSLKNSRTIVAAITLALSAPIATALVVWFEAPFSGGVLLLLVPVVAILCGVLAARAVNRTQEGRPYWTRTMTGRGAGVAVAGVVTALSIASSVFTPPRSWPTSVDAAVQVVVDHLDADSKKAIAYGEVSPLGMHFGLGMWIRNELGLWGGNFWLRSDCGEAHPDDCSAVILDALAKRLRAELPEEERLALEKLEAQMSRVTMAPFDFHEMSLKDLALLIDAAVSHQLPPSDRFSVRFDAEFADDTISWTDPEAMPFPEALMRLAANTHIEVRKSPPDLLLEPDLRPIAPTLARGAVLDPLRIVENGLRTELRELISDEAAWTKVWEDLNRAAEASVPLPDVDFERSAVLIVALGSRNSGGYGIRIEAHGADGDDGHFSVVEISPGESCVVTSSITYPTGVYVVPAPLKSARFLLGYEADDCATRAD